MKFINSIANTSNFAFLVRIFDEFFPGFRAKFQKIVTCVAFSIKFAKTNQKFAENSEFCEKNHYFSIIQNYSLHSLFRSGLVRLWLSGARLRSGPRGSRSQATRSCDAVPSDLLRPCATSEIFLVI